ncbi:hypothetical protein GYH30_039600 [Glycine max]|nr:hypothetical protein GYH30_039600 [Glycine max]
MILYYVLLLNVFFAILCFKSKKSQVFNFYSFEHKIQIFFLLLKYHIC